MRLLIPVALLALAACSPRVATLDGAEIAAPTDIVRVATLRVIHPATSHPEVELRTSDGQVFSGRLEPAEGDPGIGGPTPLDQPTRGARLIGTLAPVGASIGGPTACRFDVLNPRRWIDGGGVGLCRTESGRRLDFVF